jgi:hypothetical protein
MATRIACGRLPGVNEAENAALLVGGKWSCDGGVENAAAAAGAMLAWALPAWALLAWALLGGVAVGALGCARSGASVAGAAGNEAVDACRDATGRGVVAPASRDTAPGAGERADPWPNIAPTMNKAAPVRAKPPPAIMAMRVWAPAAEGGRSDSGLPHCGQTNLLSARTCTSCRALANEQ